MIKFEYKYCGSPDGGASVFHFFVFLCRMALTKEAEIGTIEKYSTFLHFDPNIKVDVKADHKAKQKELKNTRK